MKEMTKESVEEEKRRWNQCCSVEDGERKKEWAS